MGGRPGYGARGKNLHQARGVMGLRKFRPIISATRSTEILLPEPLNEIERMIALRSRKASGDHFREILCVLMPVLDIRPDLCTGRLRSLYHLPRIIFP